MSTSDQDFSSIIEDAKSNYEIYFQNQKDFEKPRCDISIEEEIDGKTKVLIRVQYKDTDYQFRSIEENDVNDIYQYLNSQPSVREKYNDGNTISFQATKERVNTLVQRFRDKTSSTYLYSGFILSDFQTNMFIGLANIGIGPGQGISEIAFLNRSQCWSHYNNNNTVNKVYSGVGTVETCALLEYAKILKEKGYRLNGHPLEAVVAFSRIDNEGSWKACAKAGMRLHSIEVVDRYGNKLRYHLRKDI